MAKLAPSILSADFFKLGDEINLALKHKADWIHIDVMDGQFVPPITYGSKIVADIKKNNKDVFCDVHLMVNNPENQIMQFAEAGADLINFHCEIVNHGDRFINMIKDNKKLSGITLNPVTPLSFINHYLPVVDLVLVMSVNPGYANQKCIDYTFKKVEELKNIKKANNYKFLIEIDGGISSKNVNAALNAGADVIVVGSAFFGVSDEEKKKLVEMIHNNK